MIVWHNNINIFDVNCALPYKKPKKKKHVNIFTAKCSSKLFSSAAINKLNKLKLKKKIQ